MAKYTEQFKLEVIHSYLEGTSGYNLIARRYGLERGMIRRWIKRYQEHGVDGVVKKRTVYTAEFKRLVLQAMWDHGLSHHQTASQFNIGHPPTVGQWERAYQRDGAAGLEPRKRGRPKGMAKPTDKAPKPVTDETRSRDELLAELNQLRMENAYLKKLRALIQAQQSPVPPKKRDS